MLNEIMIKGILSQKGIPAKYWDQIIDEFHKRLNFENTTILNDVIKSYMKKAVA